MTRIGVATLLSLAVLGAAASARAGSPQQVPTLYAVASKVQFIDHADDRQRGLEKNPFNADVKKLDPKAEAQEKGKGPFPGDDALFTFKLYSDAQHRNSAGTAVYECVYNFHKHAMCKAVFDLKAGSLFASGPVDFNSAHFAMAVTGGTGKYLGAHGQVADAYGVETQVNTHRVNFQLG